MVNQRVEAARRGKNPTVVQQMPSGWAVMCDWQKLPGYLILLADPVVGSLNDLAPEDRQQFLTDMAMLGDALLETTDAARINYQILGNLAPVLHAHVCPRYAWEADDLRKGPTAHYDKSSGPFFDADHHRGLMEKIRAALAELPAGEKLGRDRR